VGVNDGGEKIAVVGMQLVAAAVALLLESTRCFWAVLMAWWGRAVVAMGIGLRSSVEDGEGHVNDELRKLW
jgi:hypothetical protein